MTEIKKIIINIRSDKFQFKITETDGTTAEHEYVIDEKMSVAANLREVFREQSYMKAAKTTPDGIPCIHAVLNVSTPVVLIPIEENFDPEISYNIAITGYKYDEKCVKEIPLLDATAIFPLNKDLKMVVEDNCSEIEISNNIIQVWQTLYKNYYKGTQDRNLFVYFYNDVMNICYFEQHRFRYANSFKMKNTDDMLYYILYVWKQLGMNKDTDILSLCGEIPEGMHEKLSKFIEEVRECVL